MCGCVPIVVATGSDRGLRPMILTKQLDLQGYGEYPSVSPTTPRTNLAKELEKYNRPTMDYQYMGKPIAPKPNKDGGPTAKVVAGPDRPNILSKRPHYKPQYRYDPLPAAMNLTTKNNNNNVILGEDDITETLDLSVKRNATPDSSDSAHLDILVNSEMQAASGTPNEMLQEEPMDFSMKTQDVCTSSLSTTISMVSMASPCSTSGATINGAPAMSPPPRPVSCPSPQHHSSLR